eukprot:gene33095-42528_t
MAESVIASSTEVGGALLPQLTALVGADPTGGSLFSLTGNFMKATVNSLFMILVTEIGDKTFFIAAVLAMRNARLVVYGGAMGTSLWPLRPLRVVLVALVERQHR